jgi:hypothetical protein
MGGPVFKRHDRTASSTRAAVSVRGRGSRSRPSSAATPTTNGTRQQAARAPVGPGRRSRGPRRRGALRRRRRPSAYGRPASASPRQEPKRVQARVGEIEELFQRHGLAGRARMLTPVAVASLAQADDPKPPRNLADAAKRLSSGGGAAHGRAGHRSGAQARRRPGRRGGRRWPPLRRAASAHPAGGRARRPAQATAVHPRPHSTAARASATTARRTPSRRGLSAARESWRHGPAGRGTSRSPGRPGPHQPLPLRALNHTALVMYADPRICVIRLVDMRRPSAGWLHYV